MLRTIKRSLRSFLEISDSEKLLQQQILAISEVAQDACEELSKEISELSDKTDDLENAIEIHEDSINELETGFRNFPDAEDIPDVDEIERERENAIEEALEQYAETMRETAVERLLSVKESGDKLPNFETMVTTALVLGIIEESDVEKLQNSA